MRSIRLRGYIRKMISGLKDINVFSEEQIIYIRDSGTKPYYLKVLGLIGGASE